MNTADQLDERQLRAKAEAAAEMASRTREASVRDAFQALSRSWTKLADDLLANAAPPAARWR